MATHSSVLAWRILWMEKPGRLQSMGSHRVRHDWSDLAAAAANNSNQIEKCIMCNASPSSHVFLINFKKVLMVPYCLSHIKLGSNWWLWPLDQDLMLPRPLLTAVPVCTMMEGEHVRSLKRRGWQVAVIQLPVTSATTCDGRSINGQGMVFDRQLHSFRLPCYFIATLQQIFYPQQSDRHSTENTSIGSL